MTLLIGCAETAPIGPTAAPTATVLRMSAPAMATRVRVSCDDILISFLRTVALVGGFVTDTNQGACQSRKTAKNCLARCRLADFPNQQLVANPKPRPGTIAARGASRQRRFMRSKKHDRQAVRRVARREDRRQELRR